MTKKITFLLFVCSFFLLGHYVLAVPAAPWPSEITLPDGSKITVYLRGDEKVKWMESLDGYTLMYNAEKHIVYAELDANKNMVPSKSRYSAVSVAPSGVAKGVHYSSSQVSMLKQIWNITQQPPSPASSRLRSATTEVTHIMCALVDFSNLNFTYTQTDFENLMNQAGYSVNGSKGSVKDFYLENSYGQLDLLVTVSGVHKLSKGWDYYGENDPETEQEYLDRLEEFAMEAAQKAFTAPGINPADYDNNGDGNIDAFHIIFAGYGEEVSGSHPNRIWSHAFGFPTLTFGGKKISRYSCSPELQGNGISNPGNMTNVGVICHEMGHVFGSPDYYDTDYNGSGGNYSGSGQWDVMAGGSWNRGGTQPPHFNIFQKKLFGWLTPVELTSYTAITGMPASASDPVAYFIKVNSNNEQYIVENRQHIGFDESVPGTGLLIWHVHPGALSGRADNRGHPQQFYPVVASSTVQIPTAAVSSYGDVNSAGTPFPGTSGKTAFTASTTPAMFTWTDTQPVAKPLTDISENTTNKTVSFKFMDGPVDPVTNLQWSESAGNVTLTWDAPANPNVTGYKIYRYGVLLNTINDKTTTTYTQNGVINGTYEYGVSACYAVTESDPETVTVTVTTGSSTYSLPIRNLQGKTALHKAVLNWTPPFNEGWMTIAGAPNIIKGWLSDFTLFAGTLWGPEQLKGMDGYEITHIEFFMWETAAIENHKVQIWEVNEGIPELVLSQEYTGPRMQDFIRVKLNAPYTIDASKEYYVGVEIHTLYNRPSVVLDNNTIVSGRNWLSVDDEWIPMEALEWPNNFYSAFYLTSGNSPSPSPGIVLDSRNLEVKANNLNSFSQKMQMQPAELPALKASLSEIIQETGPSRVAPAVTTYYVYRDGMKIGESTTPSFLDDGLTAGTTYSYCVFAAYSNGNVSESVCIPLTTLAYQPAENVVASLDEDKVTLNWDAPQPIEDTFTYMTGTSTPVSANARGLVETNYFTEFILYDSNNLKHADGFKLKNVRFHPGNNTGYTYSIQIYSGNSGYIPTLIHEQPATITDNVWNDITLTTPVSIDVNKDLWIGVKIMGASSGAFGIPYYAYGEGGKGNWYNSGSVWSTATVGGSPITWPIIATLEFDDLTGYQISRNDEDIDTVGAGVLTYEDILSDAGSYTYCVAALYTGGNESDAVCADAIVIEPKSIKLAWTGAAEDNDWYEKTNWSPQAVPGSLDIVYIPEAPNYPVLDQATTVAEIHFEPGAQIGGQSHLTADAFVNYDFKSGNGKRDRWNMLSIPLGQVFPADFVFGGYPTTWVRKFKADEDGDITKGTWQTAQASTEALTFGDGFVLWLNEDDLINDPAGKGLKLLDSKLELPYFHNFETGALNCDFYTGVNQSQEYVSGTGVGIGTSTCFNFVPNNGEYERGGLSYTIDRTGAAYRLLSGASYSKPVNFFGNFAMLGNPYMATLDFDAFKSANSGTIKETYYVWTDKGYATYTSLTGPGGVEIDVPLDEFIAPLQGFIVEKKTGINESATLSFVESSMASANPAASLRASVTSMNKLDILARNSVAGVRTTIAKREGGQDEFGDLDARKIMNAISDVPEVYTLKPYRGNSIALAVNIINNDELLIPVGLSTSFMGEITLTFSGMDAYDANLSLIDVETNRTIDLTGLASYDHIINYVPKLKNGVVAGCNDRFFIRISKSVTGLKETIAEKVNVFESNGLIQIISGANNPIKEVAVYDLQGALIYKANDVNALSHSVERNWLSGAYVVRVLAEKSLDNVKVVKK